MQKALSHAKASALPAVLPSRRLTLNSENHPEDPHIVILGEFGSIQVELWALGERSGVPELQELAVLPLKFLEDAYRGQAGFCLCLLKTLPLSLSLQRQAVWVGMAGCLSYSHNLHGLSAMRKGNKLQENMIQVPGYLSRFLSLCLPLGQKLKLCIS